LPVGLQLQVLGDKTAASDLAGDDLKPCNRDADRSVGPFAREVSMAEKLSSGIILPFVHPTTKEIETEDVLEILRNLFGRASSPVVRECLKEASAEIAYLTSSEGTFEDHLIAACEEVDADHADHHHRERDAV
jgi:hypothetical protein